MNRTLQILFTGLGEKQKSIKSMFINCLFVLRAPFIFRDCNPEKPGRAGAFLPRQIKPRVGGNGEFNLDKARLGKKNSLMSTPSDSGKMMLSASQQPPRLPHAPGIPVKTGNLGMAIISCRRMDEASGVCSRDAAGGAALAQREAGPHAPGLSLKVNIYVLLSPKSFAI